MWRYCHFVQDEGPKIYCRLCHVYDDDIVNDGSVRVWRRKFNEGRANVLDEEGRARLAIVTDELVERRNKRSFRNL